MEKGKGAHYAHEIKKLGKLHLEILEILAEEDRWLTKRAISYLLHKKGRKVSGNSISGRLSELLGMGLVESRRMRVKLYDEKTQEYRFVKKPVWRITEKGLQRLRGHGCQAYH